MPAASIIRQGLGYLSVCEPEPITVQAERLWERSRELHGELRVLYKGAPVYRGSYNFSSMSARSTAGKFLANQTPELPPEKWTAIVSQFCMDVLSCEGEGEPFVTINGSSPRRAGPEFLMGPLLPTATPTLLYAPGGTGKTTLAAGVAVSMTSGLPVIPGFLPVRQMGTLILDYESTVDDWRDLLDGVSEGIGIKRPPVEYRACSRTVVDQMEKIAAHVSRSGIGLVIIDSVGMAMGAGRDGGDASESALRFFTALRQLKVTTLLLDHVKGDDIHTEKTGSKPYGSVYKLNGARSAFELRAESEPRDGVIQLLLRNEKENFRQKLQPMGLQIRRDPTGVLRFSREDVESPELVATLPTAERMRRLVIQGPMSTSDLASELGVPPSSIRTALTRDQGRRFIKLADGRIGLAR